MTLKALFVLSPALLVSFVTAQVTGAGELTTDMTAIATCGNDTKNDSEKSGTKFTRGIGAVAAHRRCSSASAGASVGSYFDWRRRRRITSARVNANTSVFGANADSKGSGAAGGDKGNGVKFALSAKADTKGRLTVTVGGFASRDQVAEASVKFGNTTMTWKAGERPKSTSVDVTIGTSGLVFETTTRAASKLDGRGRASASCYVSISFASESSSTGKCEIKKGVDGCGPELAGTASSSFFGHTVTLNTTKAFANSFGLRLWSKDGKTVTINKCPVFTDIGLQFAFSTDKDGANTTRVNLPRGDSKWFVQVVGLRFSTSGLEWQTSNALEITCTK